MGRLIFAAIGSVIFFFIAPSTVAGWVPWWISKWRPQPPFFGLEPLRWLGALLIGVGIAVVIETFARFVWQGIGTPAPVFPTKHLVARGLYRYVRNPMYCGVLATILGQALFLGDVRLLGYAAFVWLAFHLFVLTYEEPTLRRTYGADYDAFCAAVPRWIPRRQRRHVASESE